MLEVKELCYQYKKQKSDRQSGLQNVSFTLENGYIMGLLGFNGAGKSTLMKLILGTMKPDSGSVRFQGQETSENASATLQKVGFISDEAEFLRYRTLEENAELFGGLYDNFHKEQMESCLIQFGIDEDTYRLRCYGELSTGERRRFQTAFALAHEPQLLLLDEPTANLDPAARMEFMEFLQKIVTEQEISVMMTTHLTADLDGLADYIMVLDKGNMLAFMDREEMVNRYGEIELNRLILELTVDNCET